VKRDADLAKEFDGVGDRQTAQDAADDGSPPTPEVRLDDGRVRDVAPAAAADEDLRAKAAGAIEKNDGRVWVEAACEDRGRQAGRAGADDRDITRLRTIGQTCSLRRACRVGDERPRFADGHGRDRAARIAPHRSLGRVIHIADDLSPVASALRTIRRSRTM